jgi:hypothetical protein
MTGRSLCLAAALFAAAREGAATPQASPAAEVRGSIKGPWTAQPSWWGKTSTTPVALVQLSLRRTGWRGDSSQSFAVVLDDLRGLGRTQMEAASADVRFELVRDAGTLAFEGRFKDGGGAGHFVFTRNDEYVEGMGRLGYPNLDEEQLFRALIHDLSRAFVRDLAGLGYERLQMDELFRMRIHGATPEYVRELRGLGYQGLPVEQLVRLRIHRARPEFIRELKALGYEGLSAEELVRMRIHGVTPGFVRELKELGYTRVPAEDLVRMRIHGVTPEFIRRIRERSSGGVPVDRLVRLKIRGG